MTFHLLHLKNTPIFEQLQLEEALLRSDNRNWCIFNTGSPPAIVMGISGIPHELIDLPNNTLPIIKRFSGGGTVVVDENTLFVTFICQKDLHPFPAFPEPIMQWTSTLYGNLLSLKENDYVLGDKKCGGNAQYIKKDRWLHHTTLLWDYQSTHMSTLLHPKKTPPYRQNRPHSEFLTKLKDHIPTPNVIFQTIIQELQTRYGTTECHPSDVASLLTTSHRQTTQRL